MNTSARMSLEAAITDEILAEVRRLANAGPIQYAHIRQAVTTVLGTIRDEGLVKELNPSAGPQPVVLCAMSVHGGSIHMRARIDHRPRPKTSDKEGRVITMRRRSEP